MTHYIENLDAIDIKILRLLQNNSRLTTKELASSVHLSTTPVYERVRRLEQDGYITRYVALLDQEKLKFGFTVFAYVKLSKQTRMAGDSVIELVNKFPEITECYTVTGEYDFLLKVVVPDMEKYRHLVLDVIGNIDAISSVQSSFVMAEIKRTTALPI